MSDREVETATDATPSENYEYQPGEWTPVPRTIRWSRMNANQRVMVLGLAGMVWGIVVSVRLLEYLVLVEWERVMTLSSTANSEQAAAFGLIVSFLIAGIATLTCWAVFDAARHPGSNPPKWLFEVVGDG